MNNRVCAGIITYNPDISTIQKTIESIAFQVEKLFICDNGSNNLSELKTLLKKNRFSVEIISLNENFGIAKALNKMIATAKNQNFKWVLTLDQDSECPPNLIEKLMKYTSSQVAIVSPNIFYKNNEHLQSIPSATVVEKEWVITSASLTNISAWEKINGFDDYLFIDKVDYDFCIRARKAGYKILQNNEISLVHELGNLKIIKIFNKNIYITNHSPFRYFYMIRNSFYLRKKLKIGNPYKDLYTKLFKIILFEEKKFSKVRNMILGVRE
ncbi:glycosyltransferase family 2 protein [Streptococcus uberis]|nr:glycosyltransferase family 2 protein [Streptococcus uberis]